MKARAEAEANAQIQSKQQQHKQIQLPPQQSPLQMALGAAVRLQSKQASRLSSISLDNSNASAMFRQLSDCRSSTS